MKKNRIMAGLLGLVLTTVITQARETPISYMIDGSNFIVVYTGELYQSTDAINWSKVESATSPYLVKIEDKQLFFCAVVSDAPDTSILPRKDVTISLPGNVDLDVTWIEQDTFTMDSQEDEMNRRDGEIQHYVESAPVPYGRDLTIPLSDMVDLDMIWIEPGTFIMGSPEDELGRGDGETQHEVTLTQGYWLGQYEITQAQYKAIMKVNPSEFLGANRPVEVANWNDAMSFCKKLTAIEKTVGRLPNGYEYTLPTEAQWEYACRAGTTTALNSGKNLSGVYECPEMNEVGWYMFNSGETTHPVGQKQPNAWGLYDMHGNVWEWCLDWYGDYPMTAVTNPVGPETGTDRVIRGGSWYDDVSTCCRSAFRGCAGPGFDNYNYSNNGFRVALAPTKNITISLVDDEELDETWIEQDTFTMASQEDEMNRRDGEIQHYVESAPVPCSRDLTIPLSNTVDLDMIWIEPGTFIMGSPEDELGRDCDEFWHEVTLTQGYWLGQYEITQAQYKAVMGTNPSYFSGDNNPVECVSWNAARDFCAKLTEIEKTAGRLPESYEYTLPTEAQWEYACRAGTTSALNNGENLTDKNQCPNVDEVGWYAYNSGETTHPVGQKQPNVWGIYDMHGNVWEWCLDWHGKYPMTAVADPVELEADSYRVLRGGSWNNYADGCRSAYRCFSYPVIHWSNRGFRVALAPVPCSKDITIPLSDTVDLEMIWIKSGTFMMGRPEGELDRKNEESQHQVTLTRGYWIGKYEITQAQYEAVTYRNPPIPPIFEGDNLPVSSVSWEDAMTFCAKLTEQERAAGRLPEGYEYTLPTEAQWEYACRAGTTTDFNNGANVSIVEQMEDETSPNLNEVDWHAYNSNDKPHPVGQKQPNAWGLYDMHGNVSEWCLDWYGKYPMKAVADPMGPTTGEYHIIRGGSWCTDLLFCRSASRGWGAPDLQTDVLGFRVVLAPIQ